MQSRNLSPDELMAHVVDSEWDDRGNRKTRRLTKAAGFRTRAAFPEIDFATERGLDKSAFLRLSDCGWVAAGKSIIVSGPTGVGKSYLIQALGSQACMLGHRTLYFNCGKLFQTLKQKWAEGNHQRFVVRIARTPLLTPDDFGLVPLDSQDRLSLMEIIEGRGATVIASQVLLPSGSMSSATRPSRMPSTTALYLRRSGYRFPECPCKRKCRTAGAVRHLRHSCRLSRAS